jgi:hypothetical protein
MHDGGVIVDREEEEILNLVVDEAMPREENTSEGSMRMAQQARTMDGGWHLPPGTS